MQKTITLLVAITALGSFVLARSCDDDLTVQITGGLVHGIVNSSTPAVRQFLGIPYAQPPLGDLRFAPPKPPLPFGELNATAIGPGCPQYFADLPSLIVDDVLEFNLGGLNRTGATSEDCLTLSVWTPRVKNSQRLLPVLIFFYGGAFLGGGVDTPYLLPPNWIQRTQSHIVVSFNHRDNIFGFPNAAGLPPDQQNVGLLDARLAVEWVRDNIASFGGDPSRIGAWGQSSGGSAIAYLTYAYYDDPIFNSVILDSGNEFIDILTYDAAHANFTYMASHFGCGGGALSPADELACMRRVDANAMESFMHDYYANGTSPLITFSPVVDNATVFADFAARAREGKVARRLPALLGSNAQDGDLFVPYSPDGVDEALADQTTMVWFFCPTYRAARTRVAAGVKPVYRYLYSGNFSNISPRSWMGAWHGSELPLVFGTHGSYRGQSTELERMTSWAMQDAWVEFVATGGRKMSVVHWNGEQQTDGGPVAEFGNGVPARLIEASELEKRCDELQQGTGL